MSPIPRDQPPLPTPQHPLLDRPHPEPTPFIDLSTETVAYAHRPQPQPSSPHGPKLELPVGYDQHHFL